MRARVVAWVVGCGIGLTLRANAQAPAAAFPPEQKPNAPAPAVAAPPPAPQPPAAAPVLDAPPVTPAPRPSEPSHVVQPAWAHAPEPKPPRDWNLGAGVFSGGDSLTFGQGSGAPSYNAALERRLGERSWLALNLRFSYESREAAPPATNANPNPTDTLRVNMTRFGALLGVRYVFVHGLVDVSGFSALFASSQHVSDGLLRASGLLGQTGLGNSRHLGLLLGLAVERELIEALALRLSIDLATASISSDESSQLDSAQVEQRTSLGSELVGLAIHPALQLHFYF